MKPKSDPKPPAGEPPVRSRSFPRRLLRRALIFAAGLFLLVVGLSAAAGWYLHTDDARRRLQAAVNRTVAGRIVWDRMRLSPAEGRLEVSGLRVSDPDGREAIAASGLSIDVAWTRLLRAELRVESAAVEQPRVTIVRDSGGKLNLAAAFGPRQPRPKREGQKTVGLPFNIVVDTLRVSGGQVTYRDEAATLSVQAQGIRIGLKADLLARKARAAVELGAVELDREGRRIRIEGAALQARLDDSHLQVPRLQIRGEPLSLKASGEVRDLLGNPRLEAVTADLAGMLEPLRKFLALEPELNGDFRGTLKAEGPLADPDLDLNMTYDGGELWDRPVAAAAVDLSVRSRKVDIRTLRLDAVGGRSVLSGEIDLQTAFGHGLMKAPVDLETLSYRFSLVQEEIDLAQIPAAPAGLGGRAGTRVNLTGRGLDWRRLTANATIEAEARGLAAPAVSRPADFALRSRGVISDGRLALEELKLEGADLHLAGRVEFDPRTRDLDARLTLEAPDLEKALAPLNLENYQGAVRLRVEAGGRPEALKAAVDFKSDDLRIGDFSLGNLTLTADLTPDGRLEVAALEIRNRGSELKGGGTARLPEGDWTRALDSRLEFDLRFAGLESGHFITPAPTEGVFSGQIQVTGTARAPQAVVRLDGHGVAAAGTRLGDLSLAGRLAEGTLTVEALELARNDSRLHLSGQARLFRPGGWQLEPDPPFQAVLESPGLQIEDFVNGYAGRLALRAALTGSLRRPTGTVEIDGGPIATGVQHIEGLALRARLDGRRAVFERLQVDLAPGQSVTGEGWYALDRSFSLHLAAVDLELAGIDRVRQSEVADGLLRLAVTAQGSLDAPQVSGKLDLSRLTVNQRVLDDATLNFSLRDGCLHAQGRLPFAAEADFDLKSKDFSVDLAFSDTDLGPYLKLAGRNEMAGNVTGILRAAGNLDAWRQAGAEVALERLRLDYEGRPLIRADRLDARLQDGRIELPASELTLLEQGRLKLSGRARIDGPIDLKVEGLVPLAVLKAWPELPPLSGNVSIDAGAQGSWSQPLLRARVELESVGMPIEASGQKLHQVRGRLELTPEALVLHELHGKLDDGSFSLAGRAGLEDGNPRSVDLAVAGRKLPVIVPGMLEVEIDGDLTLRGAPDASELTGSVILVSGSYYQDIDVAVIGRRSQPAPAPSSDGGGFDQPFLRNLKLDVAIEHRNPFGVENNLADLEIVPDLRLYGTLGRPLVSGRAMVESGTVDVPVVSELAGISFGRKMLPKQRFTVDKGVIDFVNPYRIEPDIDIESSTRVRDWTIRMTLTGTPDALDFKLSSEPVAEHSDIVSLLVFGRTTDELSGGGSGGSGSSEEILAAAIAGVLGDDIKDTIGLDIFDVSSGDQDTGGVKVTLGKELTERMTVKYEVVTRSGESTQRTVSEYKVLDNFVLNAYQDMRGSFGAEMKYRLEFR